MAQTLETTIHLLTATGSVWPVVTAVAHGLSTAMNPATEGLMGELFVTKGDSPTGWVAYCRNFKEKYPDVVIDYKQLMQKYIKGEPV
jgi:hypothetical protein